MPKILINTCIYGSKHKPESCCKHREPGINWQFWGIHNELWWPECGSKGISDLTESDGLITPANAATLLLLLQLLLLLLLLLPSLLNNEMSQTYNDIYANSGIR